MKYVIVGGIAVAILLMGIAEAVFEEMKMHGAVKWIMRVTVTGLVIVMLLFATRIVHARDDGRYAGSPLKGWFDGLKSRKGPCCSDADGAVIKDTDWESRDGHYRVRMPFDGNVLLSDPRNVAAAGRRVHWEWIDVPDEAVIQEPNKLGLTMVWASGGSGYYIRCFMPGPGA